MVISAIGNSIFVRRQTAKCVWWRCRRFLSAFCVHQQSVCKSASVRISVTAVQDTIYATLLDNNVSGLIYLALSRRDQVLYSEIAVILPVHTCTIDSGAVFGHII